MIGEETKSEVYNELKCRVEQIGSDHCDHTINMRGFYITSEESIRGKNSYLQIYNIYFDSDGVLRGDINFSSKAQCHDIMFGKSLDELRAGELSMILDYVRRIYKIKPASEKQPKNNETGLIKKLRHALAIISKIGLTAQ